MLLQTNSYIVPRDKRDAHNRLLRKFRQVLLRLGCEHFEAYEQVGTNWSPGEATGRYVQIMRFRDRHHQQQVQAAERADPVAQAVIREFCELINFPYQQQQGLFATGFYQSAIPIASPRRPAEAPAKKRSSAASVPPTVPASSQPGVQTSKEDAPEPEGDPSDPIPTNESNTSTDEAEDCLPGLLSTAPEAAEFITEDEETESEEDDQIDFDLEDASEEPTDDDRYPASR